MNRILGLGLPTIVLLTVALGCGSRPDEAYLDLTWEEFDQTANSGWRPLAESEDYAGAASMIENYLRHHDDLIDAQRGYSTFHAGQLWALHGNTERALELLDRATVENPPQKFPRAFNPLVAGTRAFLRNDTVALRAARNEVAAIPERTPREEQFLEALDVLIESEGLTYREVFERVTKED